MALFFAIALKQTASALDAAVAPFVVPELSVALGLSAGGLAALLELFSCAPLLAAAASGPARG